MPNRVNTHPCSDLVCLHEWRGACARLYAENLLTQSNPSSYRSRFDAVQIRSGYMDRLD